MCIILQYLVTFFCTYDIIDSDQPQISHDVILSTTCPG